jgi:hypothetical protein
MIADQQAIEKAGTPPFISPISEAAEIRFPLKRSWLHAFSSAREANFNNRIDVSPQQALAANAAGDVGSHRIAVLC